MAWSDNGNWLAVSSVPSGIVVWDTSTWRTQSILPGHLGHGGVRLSFVPQSDLLASLAWDDHLRLWHVPSAREVFHMTSSVNSDAFQVSRDGQRWGGKIEDTEVNVWQIAQGTEYRSLRSQAGWDGTNRERGGAISPDGRLLALTSFYGVHLWDLTTGQDVALVPSGPARAAAFAPAGDAIYVYGPWGLYRWPMSETTGVPNRLCLGPPKRLLQTFGESVFLSADGRLLAAAINKEGGKVLRLDQPGQDIPVFRHPDTLPIALSPDGRWIAAGTKHGKGVKVWEVADRSRVHDLCEGQTEHTVGFSPDSHWFVAGAIGEYRFWRTDTWQEGMRVAADCGTVPGPIAFSPDSRMAALETAHARISLIDPETCKEFAHLEDPNGDRPSWMAFTPDGSRLVTATFGSGAVHVWELHLLRSQLAEAGLDRGLPPWPAPHEAALQPTTWEASFKLDTFARINRGRIAYDQGNFAQAVAEYQEVLRQEPMNPAACNNLAWTYVVGPHQIRKPCEALSLALTASRQTNNQSELNTLGVAYYRLGRLQEAIDALNKAVKAGGKNGASAWDAFFLAMSHHRLGHPAEARRFYDQAIALRASGSTPRPRDKAELDDMETEAKIVLSQVGDR